MADFTAVHRLPFETKIVNSKDEAVIIYRATFKTSDDAEKWLNAYAAATTTHWVVSRTYRTLQKLVYRKDYVCHRSSLRRACPGIDKQTGVRKNDRGLSKNCGCLVAVIIKIYMDKSREHYAKVSHLQIRPSGPSKTSTYGCQIYIIGILSRSVSSTFWAFHHSMT